MESNDDDADLQLIKASPSLLSDLQDALPRALWRPAKTDSAPGRVHSQVRQRDLDNILQLIEPFQGEPQLLDSKLKHIVPPIVDAYLQYLQLPKRAPKTSHWPLDTALCIILYTLCKVRGYKIIVGFLSNEPRHFEPVLQALERTLTQADVDSAAAPWQVSYVLSLWVSHLLLTPFDLASISELAPPIKLPADLEFPTSTPTLAVRCTAVGLRYLYTSTKAQDAAAAMLVRLVIRPDMQKLGLADLLTSKLLGEVSYADSNVPTSIYERIGPLRFLSGIATSADLSRLVPNIYRICEKLSNEEGGSSVVTSNAVAKKFFVKIFRNIAILSLRLTSAEGPLLSFLETTSVLEDVIDYLLRSLADRDTPVRYAAAKALSLIVLELETEMGHEVIQAVLDSFWEDVPRAGSGTPDFRTANALKWHGLTLALAHSLFKRTASPEQLPDIINALAAALQFEQRTATGSSIGTNVRDAANFGIWSMSRRYTTDELLKVSTATLRFANAGNGGQDSVIQVLAVQLILSACLDPAGNIRRGSSAALQELIGRHPDQVHEGISLVQVVEYQAVGLRRRAMVDVANQAADLHATYWAALVKGSMDWRGLGSVDVSSREAAAAALAKLNGKVPVSTPGYVVLDRVTKQLDQCSSKDSELLHGLVTAVSYIISPESDAATITPEQIANMWLRLSNMRECMGNFSPRVLRSDLPSAVASMLTALCHATLQAKEDGRHAETLPFDAVETILERLLARQEDSILQGIPALVKAAAQLKREAGVPLGCLDAQTLCGRVALDSSKSVLHGAGRAIALGALASLYENCLAGQQANASITTLANLNAVMTVDWRIIGAKALQLAVENADTGDSIGSDVLETIVQAIHRGTRDYTVDERGDVGSLVRLQALSCASSVFEYGSRCKLPEEVLNVLWTDVARLSLEKLDRVRIAAARCRHEWLGSEWAVRDVASVSTEDYFAAILNPLGAENRDLSLEGALLEGCISCAGISGERLLQASRLALVELLCHADDALLAVHMTTFAAILKNILTDAIHMHPALELLGFLLDMQIPQRLAGRTDFKWRNLLSTVQKAHHKSNDIQKIVAAVNVYRELAGVANIRGEVLKKLVSMLKTNPYPRVRIAVAETLSITTKEERLLSVNWAAPIVNNKQTVAALEASVLAG
ncbi:hypothetical protein D0862_04089 [Hortaea werneckii]|uniref:Uncharacterized protein n=1 Tax=Hortaea werneckii TaxID=91943 RepID=A0A3M7H489_HORWE|nr:hypothetical protein D0862_04089 [Hortaea werneckii]